MVKPKTAPTTKSTKTETPSLPSGLYNTQKLLQDGFKKAGQCPVGKLLLSVGVLEGHFLHTQIFFALTPFCN